MTVLGVDSSSKSAGAALVKDGKVLYESFLNVGLTHSQTLMTLIDDCFKNTSTDIAQVDCFAVTNGPGSFTGIRIGLACVKGLAFTNNSKCCIISTLEALSVNASNFTGKIYCVLDARCSQVYFAEFISDGKTVKRLCEDCAITLEELKFKALGENENVILVGDGAELCYEYLVKDCPNVNITNENNRFVKGSSVALSAVKKGIFFDAKDIVPEYLRLPQAQRNLKKGES